MKITAIKPYTAWSVWRNVFLVKVETDEGIYGWGEGGTSWRELGVKGSLNTSVNGLLAEIRCRWDGFGKKCIVARILKVAGLSRLRCRL